MVQWLGQIPAIQVARAQFPVLAGKKVAAIRRDRCSNGSINRGSLYHCTQHMWVGSGAAYNIFVSGWGEGL